ncbi:coil containing protein [Vibrio phage 1.023.O._10N.222.51.B4]|nr:coil containing protein [Vibrio phage 1.023.O._10N.222.51.B4]
MTTAATHIKKLLNLKFFDGYLGLIEPIETLIKERDEAQGTINGLKQLLELPESEGLTELFNAVEALELNKSERSALMSMRNDLETLIKGNGYWKGNTLDSVARLIEIATAPDATQPQLSEIRYVLHGDIQPCSVLYSDDTTTLLRLDEGDMMLETDTIEWSDSVTYRCQELLKSVDVRSLGHVAPRLAKLVRDERILLNDNGDGASVDTVHIKADNFTSEELITVSTVEIHTLGEKGPRQYLAERLGSPVGDVEQPCGECGHVFDVDSMTCPMCNTIRPSKQER